MHSFAESDISDNIVLFNNATPINLINLICILLFIYLLLLLLWKIRFTWWYAQKGCMSTLHSQKNHSLLYLQSTDKILKNNYIF